MREAITWFKRHAETEDLYLKYTENLFSHLQDTGFSDSLSNTDRDFLKTRYFPSLVKLKLEFWKSKDPALSAIYLDERLRYAPHRLPLQERALFFKRLLTSEIEMFSEMGIPLCVADEYKRLNSPITKECLGKSVNILAVGDCLLNEVRAFLPNINDSVATDMRCIYFSANQSCGLSLLDIRSHIEKYKLDFVAFSFLSYEALPGYSRQLQYASSMSLDELVEGANSLLAIIKDTLNELRKDTDITFLLHGASGLPLNRYRKRLPLVKPLNTHQEFLVDYLDSSLRYLASDLENCLFIDERKLAKARGYKVLSRQIAPQKKYGGLFHTTWFGKQLAEEIYFPLISAYNNLSKCKLLLVDFDNTLWKGVMADGEVKQYHDRQTLLRQLKESGIILVALSKNSPENIRWDEMTLKQEDFALLKINWNPKAQSVKEVSSILNLGINSFVLLDDSQQERSLIKNELPEVICLNSLESCTWSSLDWMKEFPNTQNTDEAKLRTKMYQDQALRHDSISAEVDFPSMMRSLKLWYKLSFIEEKQLDRAHELISRTNQFNTTTIRYSRNDLEKYIKDSDYVLLYGELGDKFGSFGIVSTLIIKKYISVESENIFFIESYVMSCRAMGFNYEFQILSDVETLARKLGAAAVKGRFIPTDRNAPCSTLYETVGFKKLNENEWQLPISETKTIPNIDWFESR